ncbi:MAG: biopolymer transporter ExbD [Kiritimatiellae bacterium]|nr:biopolymer transporter ExbD [Kiritimatiellia bacterium]MCO6401731.1 biopolymer transporter ExbD [Verrucomicrobiota bacterium]
MNFRSNAKSEPLAFQMTPMIDVVFLLLCFFVSSQIFAQWETEIDITLPTARTGEVPQRLPGEIIVNILASGEVIVNGRSLDSEQLGSMLSRVVTLFPGQPVLLRADKTTAYEHVIRVLDLCRQSDIWNISFATGVPEG